MRVRQLEARDIRMAAADDSECEFATSFYQQTQSENQGQTLHSSEAHAARQAAAAVRSYNSMPIRDTLHRSVPEITNNVGALSLFQNPLQSKQCGVSQVLQQSVVASSTKAASCYRSSSLSPQHISSVNRKTKAAGRTVRQLGQQMIRDHQARQQVINCSQDVQNTVQHRYSDAGVAALMRQYSSLFKELGIQQGVIVSGTYDPTASEHWPLSGKMPVTSRKTIPHHKVRDNSRCEAASCIGNEVNAGKAGRLTKPCAEYGLSGILATAIEVQHMPSQHCTTPARCTSVPYERSSFGLSTVLRGARSSHDRASPHG